MGVDIFAIYGEQRDRLELLEKSLREHGLGGDSQALSDAMAPFNAMNKHELCLNLITMLLSLKVELVGGGGPGGSSSDAGPGHAGGVGYEPEEES